MREPVFVHAWFRSSSTFIWSVLRKETENCCYYEPLNEELPHWTPQMLRSWNSSAFSGDNHPPLDRPYFYEYLDLIETGRLGFDPDISYGRYLLYPGDRDDGLRAYLTKLMDHASNHQRRPILCFCRSQMRSTWMRATFGGLHIGQVRNPIDQWASFGRHVYFRQRLVVTAASLLNELPQDPSLAFLVATAQGRPTGQEAFLCFLLIWLASALHVLCSGSFVLDVDRLTLEAELRDATTTALRSAGLKLELGELKTPVTRVNYSKDSGVGDALYTVLRALVGPARRLIPRELSMAIPPSGCLWEPTAKIVDRAVATLK